MSYSDFMVSDDPTTRLVLGKYPIINRLIHEVHGSGVDCEWNADETPTNVRIYNAFHLMNEAGMYYATSSFVVVIPKKDPKKFVIHYTDDQSRYYGTKHMIKDYLYDTISYELDKILKTSQKRKIKKPPRRR